VVDSDGICSLASNNLISAIAMIKVLSFFITGITLGSSFFHVNTCYTCCVEVISMSEYQNATISLPKEILRKAKHIAVDRQTSLSGLLAKTLEEIVLNQDAYQQAKARQESVMEKRPALGIKGKISWTRAELHER
jgi:hypothetical protein